MHTFQYIIFIFDSLTYAKHKLTFLQELLYHKKMLAFPKK